MFITTKLIVFLLPLCLGRVFLESSEEGGTTKRPYDIKDDSSTPTLNMRIAPEDFVEIMAGETGYLECEVGGSPQPTIYWLKDGRKISQSLYETSDIDDVEESDAGRGFTRSKLILDCVAPSDAGKYTCVAVNDYVDIYKTSDISVVGTSQDESIKMCLAKKTSGFPARIYMWTQIRLDDMGNDVQLFCRSDGNPQPYVTWSGPDNETLVDPEKYEILQNGDLIIRNIIWADMGGYICEAKNSEGSDDVTVFFFPTVPEEEAAV